MAWLLFFSARFIGPFRGLRSALRLKCPVPRTRPQKSVAAATAFGVLVGIMVLSSGCDAPGQKVDALRKSEFKVVQFARGDVKSTEEKLNSLADDGWEYVGVVTVGAGPGGNRPGEGLATVVGVAFKRPKKMKD